MAVVRGVSLADSGASAVTGIFITLSAPAGTTAGDQLLVSIELREAPDTINPTWRAPTGWTLIAEVPTTGASSSGTGFLYRALYGTDVTGTSWTWDAGAGNTIGSRWTAELVALNGTSVGAYHTGAATAQASASTSQASGSITTTVVTQQYAFAGSRLTGGVTYTWPAGWTEVADAGNGAVTNGPSLSSASRDTTQAAGTYSVTATASASVTNGWAGIVAYALPAGFSGSVALSGSGSLTFSGTPNVTGSLALGADGTLSLSGVGSSQISGSVNLSADGQLSFSGVATQPPIGTLVFRSPIVQRRMPISPPLTALINFSPAVLRIAGQWVETEFPSEDQINSADIYLPGGYRNVVDQATAVILIAAGYTVDTEST